MTASSRFPRRLSRTTLALVLWCWFVPGTALPGTWKLGPYEIVTGAASSGPLREHLQATSLTRWTFVSAVGGVAFGEVARVDPSLDGFDLYYDPERPDGQRLLLVVGDKAYSANLYDWMLVPIARFADSDMEACVSLFGPRQSSTEFDVRYHEAFENTLLGMRLLQADLLLIDPTETWQLPTWNGQVILGAGERAPSHQNPLAISMASLLLLSSRARSWVFTDQGERVQVNVIAGKPRFTGSPYYSFWFDPEPGPRSPLRLGGLVGEALLRDRRVEIDESTTDGFKKRPDVVRMLNPAVYHAAQSTMQYAALFRRVRSSRPFHWRRFIWSLPSAVEPRVETPTRWPKHP